MKNFISSSNTRLFAYFFLMWSLAVTQPLMRVFGQQPIFFVAHEIRGLNLIISTLVLNILPPLILFLSLYVIGFLSKHLKEWLSRLSILLLSLLFLLSMLTSFSSMFALVTSVIGAFILTVALIKINGVKTYAFLFAPVSVIFIVLFLFFSPVKQLIYTNSSNNSKAINGKEAPIFIFVFDELPLLSLLDNNKKIDASRFPAFAEFANEATWYPNTHAISNTTELALPAILSGIKPSTSKKRIGTYQQYPNNLFTLFANSHNIHAIENTSRMCPPYLCKSVLENPYRLLTEDVLVSYLYLIVPRDKKSILPPINDRWIGYLREMKNEKRKSFDFSERLNKFDSFVQSFSDYPNNSLHFLHILLPHAPWRILPDLKLYGFYEHDGIAGELAKENPLTKTGLSHEWSNDKWATQLGWRRHLLQVGGVDHLLKKALNEIKSLGLFDKATIIVVVDHGSAFKAGMSRRYAHGDNDADIVSVPLLIKYPNQSLGKIDTRLASNLDILPTLLDVNNVDTNNLKIDGVSLIGESIRTIPEVMIQEDQSIWEQPVDYNQLFEQSLKIKNKLFPHSGWRGIFHPQDTERFYKKNVSNLDIKYTHNNAIKLMNANLFQTFDTTSRYVPVYYRLQLLSEMYPKEILVAVNNTLVSHCYLFVHEKNNCAGLIDPNDFQKGAINMRFFAVLDDGNDTYIVDELLPESQQKASLVTHKDETIIQLDNGEKLTIDNQAIPAGEATLRLIEDTTTYQVDGWAGDTLTGQVAKTVYLFINNKLYATTETGVEKNYVYLRYGFKSLLNSGFQINIPKTQLPDIEHKKLRVYAKMQSGKIIKLNYHADKANPELVELFKPFINKAIPIDDSEVLALKTQYLKNENLLNKTVFDAFDDDFSELSIGQWFTIKRHARWIGSSIVFAIPNKNKFKTLKIQITAKPYLYNELVKQQRLIIKVNGQQVNETTFVNKDTKEIDINVSSRDTSKPLVVKFEMPDAVAPSSISGSQDSRLLSLHITDFKVSLIQ
jgi:hypothetical protein